MSNNSNYDIIVIGAGCGGLTAAVCAAQKGKKVLLLERHNAPGGFATSFVRGRFEFEASIDSLSCFGNSEGLGEVRQIFDEIEISANLKPMEIPSIYRFISTTRTGEKIDVEMPFGIDEYINAMENYVPGSKKSMSRLFCLAEEIYNATNHLSSLEGQPNFSQIRNIMNKYGNFVRTAPYSVNEVLDALEIPHKARDIFEAHWMNLGVDCDRLNFVHYILTIYNLLTLGAVVPQMKSYSLSMALASKLEDLGGEIRYHSPVTRIKFSNGQVCGVMLKNNDTVYANHIICNCSPTTVYAKLIKAKDLPKSAVKRTNARTFGARSACVYLGLNRSASDLKINDYSVIITSSSDSTEQYEKMKNIDSNEAMVATCLNIVNPECSPQGTAILKLTTFYTDNCWADVAPEEYFNEKDLLAARLITSYEKATGISIHNFIEEIEVSTPVTFARYTATPQGVTHGYFPADWDSLLPRIMTEETDNDIKGLRFCGGWGTQLNGLNNAIVTGRNTAYATLEDISMERGVNSEQ